MLGRKFLLISALSCFIASCATIPSVSESEKQPASEEMNIQPVSFSSLEGWENEDFMDFANAYEKSCQRILKKDTQALFGVSEEFGKAQEWQIACRRFGNINKNNPAAIRQFFETSFTPYQVSVGQNAEGLFTGYYEASLRGSRLQKGLYQYPLRLRPDDLVMVNLGEFREELKGQRIAGRVKDGQLKPYETHAEILANKLPKDQDKTLVWVDNAVDAFFIQIQGSGIVQLDDGTTMRVGYAGQNGHPYYAIGRELVKRGELEQEQVSMQSIKSWLGSHPSQAQEIMTTNKSYVFFKELKGEGPVGGEGITLTPMRSLAVDHSIIPYGMPVYISAEHPEQNNKKLSRLMMAQDTGGAIQGAVRGDFFWGYGPQAEKLAGAMKSKGHYWFLLPKAL